MTFVTIKLNNPNIFQLLFVDKCDTNDIDYPMKSTRIKEKKPKKITAGK